MPSGFRAYALVPYAEFQEKNANLSPDRQRVFPIYNNPKFKQAGRVHLSLLENGSYLLSMSEVPRKITGTFAREMGNILQRNNLGFSGGH